MSFIDITKRMPGTYQHQEVQGSFSFYLWDMVNHQNSEFSFLNISAPWCTFYMQKVPRRLNTVLTIFVAQATDSGENIETEKLTNCQRGDQKSSIESTLLNLKTYKIKYVKSTEILSLMPEMVSLHDIKFISLALDDVDIFLFAILIYHYY